MYIRNYEGDIVFFDKEKYAFEYDMYVDLWKILYNIDLLIISYSLDRDK